MLISYESNEHLSRGFTFSEGKGFTLVELLVVITIIGLLASMVLVSMGGSRSKARDTRRMSDMRQLFLAQEMYYGNNNKYYTAGGTVGNQTMPIAISTFLPTVPKDPGGNTIVACTLAGGNTAGAYTYCQIDNQSATNGFCYYTRLENTKTIGGTVYYYYTASENGNIYRTTQPKILGRATTGCGLQE